DERLRQPGEVVAAPAHRERHRLQVGEARNEGLQRRTHRGDHDEWMLRARQLLPLGHAAQRVNAPPHRLRAGAQTLVRERLPRRKLQHLSVGHDTGEGGTERVGIPTRRDDRHERPSLAALREQARQQRRAEPVGEGEVGVASGGFEGARERVGALKPRTQTFKSHRTSLRAPFSTMLRYSATGLEGGAWKRCCAASTPAAATASTASAASETTDGRVSRSVDEKSRSTKDAASWRPGGRPTPTRTRTKSPEPTAAITSRTPLWPPGPPPTLIRTVSNGRSNSSCTTM